MSPEFVYKMSEIVGGVDFSGSEFLWLKVEPAAADWC